MAGNYINVQTTKSIWQNPVTSASFNLKNTAVWRIYIPALISFLPDLQLLMDSSETEKIKRYHHEKDRQSRTISRSVLKILVGKYLGTSPSEISFQLDHNQKLLLKYTSFGNLHFNVSHSGDWVLIAISTNPVGVDLEQINASFTYQTLLDFSFSLEEKNYIQSNINPRKTFYQLWTRKEALLKATGKGLTDDLIYVPSLDGNHHNPKHITGSGESWQITSFDIDERHLGSAVFMPVKTALQFFNFQF